MKDKVSEAVDRAIEKTKKKMSKKEFSKYKKLALEYYKSDFPEYLRLVVGKRTLGRKEILEEIKKESEIGKIIVEGVRFNYILDKELKRLGK